MSKSAIGSVNTPNPALNQALAAIKQNLDQITGQTKDSKRMEPLLPNATSAEIIARLNEIAARLQ